MGIRILIYAIIFALIYFGIRKILKDWRERFKEVDEQTRKRDLKERQRPDVIDLKRDDDGIYRPGDEDK